MPEGYRHLTHEDRCQIHALKGSGLSDGAIALQLGRVRPGCALPAPGRTRPARRPGGGVALPGECG